MTDAPAPFRVQECNLTDGTTEFHLVDANGHTLLRQRDVNGRTGKVAVDFLQRLCDAVNATSPEVLALAKAVYKWDSMGPHGANGTDRYLASSLLAQHIAGNK